MTSGKVLLRDYLIIKVDADASFVNFVYPFLFDENFYIERCAKISDAVWSQRNGQNAPVWKEEELKASAMAVVRVTNKYDDEVVACFGGTRATDRG